MQPLGRGKFIFDIGCEQHGEYIQTVQVKEIVQVVVSIRGLSKSNLLLRNI